MVAEEKLAAVREWLMAAFPGCAIEDRSEPHGHVFQINCGSSTYIVVLADEFVRKHDPSNIGAALSKITLVEHLRELPDTPVVVTNAGLKLQYD